MNLKRVLFLLVPLIFMFSQSSIASAADPIEEVRELINTYYVEEVSDATLAQPTIEEITDQLDIYSEHLTQQEVEQLTNAIDQQLVGIGIVLEEHAKGVEVLYTIPNGPAHLAGIQAGDIITTVDGQIVAGQSMETVVSYLSGEADTFVNIIILRPSTGATLTRTVERKVVSLPNIEAQMLGGEVGYIRLYSFSEDGADEIQAAIQSLKGAKAFILDLRDNGGGYVLSAQEVVGLFPNLNQAYQMKDRSGIPENYEAIKQETQFSKPVNILINENSASASEMVSSSVQEQEGATLYGQTTYGKGSMQVVFALSDQSALKLTIAKFYSPDGTEINEVGVTPDVTTPIGEELALSHHDQLVKIYDNYQKRANKDDVETSKTFTVEFHQALNWVTVSPEDVQLVQLGGEEVEVGIQMINHKTVQVTPQEPLQSDEQYMLLIHPNLLTEDNQKLETGIYIESSI